MTMALLGGLPSLNTCKRRIRSPFSWADSLRWLRGSSRKQAVNVSAPPHHWGLLLFLLLFGLLWQRRKLKTSIYWVDAMNGSLRKPVEPLLTVSGAKSRFLVKYSPNPNLWSKLLWKGKTNLAPKELYYIALSLL